MTETSVLRALSRVGRGSNSYRLDPHEIFDQGVHRLVSRASPEFPQRAVWDAYNMVYERSSADLEKMQGYTRIGTNSVNDVCSGLFDYEEGTEIIATSEDGGIYKSTGGNWSAVTGGAAATFATTSNLRWSGDMFYGQTTGSRLLVLANGSDAPQKYTSLAGISALGGSPPSTGKFPLSFAGRYWLFTGDVAHYSAADDAENWSGGGSFQIDRGSGDITGAYVFAGNLLIFKRRRIFRLLPGTTLQGTSVREVSRVLGTSSHQTIAETTGSFRAGALFFRSDEAIHEIVPTSATGGFYIRNAAEPIKPILDRQDTSNLATNWATYNPVRGEYWLQYTLNDAQPDEGVIGNVARGERPRWTRHDMRGKTAGTMRVKSGGYVQIIADENGAVYELHDTTYSRGTAGYRGYVTTASYAQGDRSRMKLYGRIFVDVEYTNIGATNPLTVATSLGRYNLPSPAGETNRLSIDADPDGWGVGTWGVAVWGGSTANGEWFRPARTRRGSHIELRIETSGVDQWFRLNGLAVEYDYRRRILAA